MKKLLIAFVFTWFLGLILAGCASIPPATSPPNKSPMVRSGSTNGPIEYGVRKDGTIEIRIPDFYREFMEYMIRKEMADPGIQKQADL